MARLLRDRWRRQEQRGLVSERRSFVRRRPPPLLPLQSPLQSPLPLPPPTRATTVIRENNELNNL
jgi:hypothetical protein